MGIKEDVHALADELDGVSIKDNCEACLASGTELCRGDLECAESAHKACAKRLRAIVEKDADDVTTMSAYDLLPEDERKAIAWVREHGGIAEVKDEWKRRNNLKRRLEKAQDKVGRQQRHIEELQRKLAERRDGINAMRSQMAEMSKRLMPEGMEWPKYTDGALVEIGDEVVGPDYGERINVDAVKFHANGFTLYDKNGFDKWYEDDDRFERPAPKVVDADGVEIHEGDTVYQMGCKYRVSHLHGSNGKVRIVYENSGRWVDPKTLTHRAPVLAADGKPVKPGELVWSVKTGKGPHLVMDITDGHAIVDGAVGTTPGEMLTHEQPDDWSRWREDLELSPVEYADRYRVGRFGHEELDTYRDLVRRARKLAERGA